MENIQITTKKYIGLNKAQNIFSAVFMHTTKKQSLRQTRGDMFSSVSLYTEKVGVDVSPFVSQILDKLEDQYFSEVTGTVMNALELALKGAFETFINIRDDRNLEDLTFDLSTVVVWGDVVYMGRIGKAGMYLIRQNKVINITENLIEVDRFNPISVASGVVQDSDIFVLATPLASELIVNWKNLSSMSEGELEDYIKSMDPSEGLSLLFVNVNLPQVEESPINMQSPVIDKEKLKEVGSKIGGHASKLKPLIGKLINFIRSIEYAKLIDYIKNFDVEKLKKSRKLIVLVLIILIFLFVILLILTKRSHASSNNTASFNLYISKVNASIPNIIPGTTSNILQSDDSIIQSDKDLLSKARSLNIDNKKVDELSSNISDKFNQIHLITPISSYTVLTDMGISYPNSSPSQILQKNGKVYILDDSLHEIFTVNDSGEQTPHSWLNASNGSSNPISMANTNTNQIYVFDKDNGMLSVDSTSAKVNSIAGLGEVKNINNINVYGTSNIIYLLDPVDSEIFKSTPSSGGGYNLVQGYITDSNLKNANKVFVDGNIFVLPSHSTTLLKYYAGNPSPFKIGNSQILDKNISSITSFYTSEHLNNIYLIDSSNQRIIVLSKPQSNQDSGTYNIVKQYVYEGSRDLFKSMKDIYVSSDESEMFLICAQKIVKVSLS